MNLLKEFKPALLFLGKFLVLYLAGNILYGVYVESYGTHPDKITMAVTSQTASLLNVLGYDTSVKENETRPVVALLQHDKLVLNVFEGCNGINVMIVFIAFLIAYGNPKFHLLWFIPLGLMIIHVFNLLRLGLLYALVKNNSPHFYYFHKYFFTAVLYLIVFVLWAVWVKNYNGSKYKQPSPKLGKN